MSDDSLSLELLLLLSGWSVSGGGSVAGVVSGGAVTWVAEGSGISA